MSTNVKRNNALYMWILLVRFAGYCVLYTIGDLLSTIYCLVYICCYYVYIQIIHFIFYNNSC